MEDPTKTGEAVAIATPAVAEDAITDIADVLEVDPGVEVDEEGPGHDPGLGLGPDQEGLGQGTEPPEGNHVRTVVLPVAHPIAGAPVNIEGGIDQSRGALVRNGRVQPSRRPETVLWRRIRMDAAVPTARVIRMKILLDLAEADPRAPSKIDSLDHVPNQAADLGCLQTGRCFSRYFRKIFSSSRRVVYFVVDRRIFG